MPKNVQKKNETSQPKPLVGLRKSKANVEGNNPKDRYGLAKVPFSLIPQSAKVLMAMGFKHGAEKYGPYNWRVEPIQARIYLEAAERHLNLLLDGEDYDRDTGLHHAAFILSTIGIYIDAMVQGTLIDNRPIEGRTGDLVAFFNKVPGQERTKEELRIGFKNLIEPDQACTCEYIDVEFIRPTTKGTPVKRSSKRTVKKGKRNARR